MSEIPKIIHYCWFGGEELSDDAKKCIESWKRLCPDYQIKEWNESNFDINCCAYVQEAYTAKKWAFVSDYARFWILYNYGGIYFDTDVEILKSINPIIDKGSFMAWEENGENIEGPYVAPGLGLAFEKHNNVCGEIVNKYESIHFINNDGEINIKDNVVTIVSEILVNRGLVLDKRFQTICGVNIYPADYFCPMNKFTGEVNITPNTYSIHYYSATWLSKKERKMLEFERKNNKRIFINKFLYKFIKNVYCYGIGKTFIKLAKYIINIFYRKGI